MTPPAPSGSDVVIGVDLASGRDFTNVAVWDGASRFGCVGGNVIAYDPNEAPESMRKALAAFAKFTDGVGKGRARALVTDGWSVVSVHRCRRGRLWRKRARSGDAESLGGPRAHSGMSASKEAGGARSQERLEQSPAAGHPLLTTRRVGGNPAL